MGNLIKQRHSFYIAACDDEPQEIEKITEMIYKVCEAESIEPHLSCFNSGKDLIDTIESGKTFDLILLDVMMQQENGMELAKLLRDGSFTGHIVFISSNKEMALRGYEVSATRYLAKPVEEERLREAILYCFNRTKMNRAILLPVNGGTQMLHPEEIMYIETQGRGCHIVLKNKECYTVMRISELEAELTNQGFVRCHQSFLVNMRFIRVVRTSELELMNGIHIPVSKHRIHEVRKQFFSWMEQ